MKTKHIVAFLVVCSFVSTTLCISPATHADYAIDPSQSTAALDSLLTPISTIEAAYANQVSDLSITVKGKVTRILSDDTVGDTHQRFIIQLSNKRTLLIAHNIDISPRVAGITVGAYVYVHGYYVWNDQGGLVHWTHHDPTGNHEDGWIVLGETKFE